MNGLIALLVVMGMLATGFVLVRGMVIMARGNDVTGERQNKMMWYRVLFQAVTIALVVLLLAVVGGRS